MSGRGGRGAMLLEALKKRREKDQAKPAAAGDEGEEVPASEGASPSRAPTSTPVTAAGAAGAAASPDILSTASPELAQTSYIEPEVLAEKLRMLEVSKDEDAEDKKELSTTLVTACSGKTIITNCSLISK
jgi:hypothetical protein